MQTTLNPGNFQTAVSRTTTDISLGTVCLKYGDEVSHTLSALLWRDAYDLHALWTHFMAS